MENLDDLDSVKEFLEKAELMQYYGVFREFLKIYKASQFQFVTKEDLIQLGFSKPELRRYKKLISKRFPNSCYARIRRFLTPHKETNTYFQCSLSVEMQPIVGNPAKIPTKHIIFIEDITMHKKIGMGNFGVVQQGTWTTGNQRIQVAVKCLGPDRLPSSFEEFVKEAAIMHRIEHANIVRFYGVVFHEGSLMLVTELAPFRSLLECLREPSHRRFFPVPVLTDFAEQICDGMNYLEKKRLIHRDLAARNILVFDKGRVKISDFGLSRALNAGTDYYQSNRNVNVKLPVAWCAPECILYLKFTSASDVWAFGVCVWEMFTYGFQPWATCSGFEILEAIDSPHFKRLERPDCCPEAYYDMMLECWAHDPSERPKFKDLAIKLRLIRPEQVQALRDFSPKGTERSYLLEFKARDIITVTGKEDDSISRPRIWYGVLSSGVSGMFDPDLTKAYTKPNTLGSLSPRPGRNSVLSIPMLRMDRKRHTYAGKQLIQRSMISSPQGDVKHTGHVGLDGAYFGDISFLDPAGYPPRQVVMPYRPSDDLEQVPLINPHSPSHLTASPSSMTYPILAPRDNRNTHTVHVDISCRETRPKSLKKYNFKPVSEPSTSKRILHKVKCATLGRSHRTDEGSTSKAGEVHEYHEISDTDNESVMDNARQETGVLPESPGSRKSFNEFSQCLVSQMEAMFHRFEEKHQAECSAKSKSDLYVPMKDTVRAYKASKAVEESHLYTGTMKPMSAHDQKTLDTAVALANEITTRSMNDLANEKVPSSPSSKFHFKFPHVSLHPEADKDAAGKQERRNFTEEANSVPDIQATITEESKHAYTSLIEEPTPSTSFISKIASGLQNTSKSTLFRVWSKPPRHSPRTPTSDDDTSEIKTELPLPPRATKPKLVDKPRHFRKYPLKLPVSDPNEVEDKPIIYQNAHPDPVIVVNEVALVHKEEKEGVDVFDGPGTSTGDTNPFNTNYSQGSANPFERFYDSLDVYEESDDSNGEDFEQGNLMKDCIDHVSVEDLLEFADHRPCGRQRGVESDEVRIMCKVLKHQVTPEECLAALEFSDWNVHLSLKLIRVKMSVGSDVALEDCCFELIKYNGDVAKACSVLFSNKA